MKNMIFRKDEIVKYCKDKTVLHLGYIQHQLYDQKIKENDWLHSKISQVAKKLVGFDFLKEDVEIIKEKYGYEGYYADVMKLDDVKINEKFDVVVCGELIEHIENPGLMLDGVKRFMNKDSELLVTTPNPWSSHRLLLYKKGILEKEWLNEEHVSWFSYETLKHLLTRKGFREELYTYYYGNTKSSTNNTKGIIGYFKDLKRKFIENKTQVKNYDGLFFVAKIDSSEK